MARLKPLGSADDTQKVTFSISITQEMLEQLNEEQKRIGARSMAELGRMILEEYFKQEVPEEWQPATQTNIN